MVATNYFVSSYNHVVENNGWNYKVEGRYDSLDTAKKAYHALLGNYIDNATYDSVVVILTDSFGNRLNGEWWQAPAPEPQPEPTEE